MPKFKPQHSRLLFIDKKIRDQTYPNCSSLAEEWEVSSKTIQRDIEYLRDMLDAPLSYSAKNRGYFYTENSFTLPAFDLNDSDLFAIFIADKLLQQYKNTPVYLRLQSVFARIEDSLPEKVSFHPALMDDKCSFVASPQTFINPQVWETIFTGLRESKSLTVTHKKPSATTSHSRSIDPYHVTSYQGEWYVIGFCHLRKAIRTFAISRVTHANVTDNSFSIPEDFDFDTASIEHFGVHWGQNSYKVQIWFSRDASPYIQERQYHPTQQIEENDDGSINVALVTNHLLEVKRWVLSWGDQAKALAPDALIDEIRDELEKARIQYESQT
jgi:predicted DNA-binding transcriptional regulator YafY